MCVIELTRPDGSKKTYFFANNFSVEIRDEVVEINSYKLYVRFKPECAYGGSSIESNISRLHPKGFVQFRLVEKEVWDDFRC